MGVVVGVGVSLIVGVGVGVTLQDKTIICSHPVESVAITNTSPNNELPSKSGIANSNIGGTEATPVATKEQYVLVVSQIVMLYGD
jgi:hypothetical protein